MADERSRAWAQDLAKQHQDVLNGEPGRQTLSQAEIETLLATVQFDARPPGTLAANGPAHSTHSSPERLSIGNRLEKRQMRALKAVFEQFAALVAPALARLARANVQVSLESIDEVRFVEYLSGLEPVTCLSVVRAAPLAGSLLLDQSLRTVFAMLDRMLGGGHEPTTAPTRPLTELEQRLWSRVGTATTQALRDSFRGVVEIEPRIERVESRPSAVRMLAAEERIVRIRFQLALETSSGHWTFGIPYSALEPVWKALLDRPISSKSSTAVADQSVAVLAVLAESTISKADLEQLGLGDIIATEQAVGCGVSITLDDVPKFRACLGSHDGHKAVRVESEIDAKDNRGG